MPLPSPLPLSPSSLFEMSKIGRGRLREDRKTGFLSILIIEGFGNERDLGTDGLMIGDKWSEQPEGHSFTISEPINEAQNRNRPAPGRPRLSIQGRRCHLLIVVAALPRSTNG